MSEKILVVVESPSKAKKIGEMLGSNFVVQASGGHIRDLPGKENGWTPETFEPVYEPTERGADSIKYLKSKAALCGAVLLATDPDREGEAIAFHVAEVLKLKIRQRVKFHEITPAAILKAVQNPEPLLNNLVRAQEARRIIDRLVGWLVSSPLSKMINEKASAGRVQSPAMALVVERERTIKNFQKELRFAVKIQFAGNWFANWDADKCTSKADAEKAASVRTFFVKNYNDEDQTEVPPAPFDTALMQQAASVALKIDPEQTMKIAQSLFEQGLITYHRTDESNLSEDAFLMISEFARANGFATISTRRKFKSAPGAQEAHEAIRPTHFDQVPNLSGDEKALYDLIFKRAVCCQLADAVYSSRRVKLVDAESKTFSYSANGRTLKESGWRALGIAAEVETEDEEDELPANPVPKISCDEKISSTENGKISESFTRPPARFTKAELVKTLKHLGIGRPSTFAPSVDGIEKKGYVKIEKRRLVPTPLADKIYDALKGKFAFIEVDFTRKLEQDLDAITAGEKSFLEVVKGVHITLSTELKALGITVSDQQKIPAKPAVLATGETVKCPKCGGKMVQRTSSRGFFFGCAKFPKCNGTKSVS
jgi:DNA topoisomerase-1